MKFALLNFKWKMEDKVQISSDNRAFQYNDGLFETLICENGKVKFIEDHLLRLYLAAQALRLNLIPELVDPFFMENRILELAKANKLEKETARVKLKVWRSGAGLYTPKKSEVESLLTIQKSAPIKPIIESCGVAQTIRTVYSPLSFFKGPYSLHYVLAGIEKTEKQLDEIILLDAFDQVSEGSSSNIFWIKDEVVYTPSLQTGCIAGIMRKNIIKKCSELKFEVKEGGFALVDVLLADAVFTSNVTGIRMLKQIDKQTFAEIHPVMEVLKKALG